MTARFPSSASANDFAGLKAEFLDSALRSDPVHGSQVSAAESAARFGAVLQPADHADPIYFPPIAQSFGLQRHTPSPSDNITYNRSRGPKCVLEEGVVASCHRSEICIPAFCYTLPQILCRNAQAVGAPTVLSRYTISPTLQLKLQTCLYCFSNTKAKGCIASSHPSLDLVRPIPRPLRTHSPESEEADELAGESSDSSQDQDLGLLPPSPTPGPRESASRALTTRAKGKAAASASTSQAAGASSPATPAKAAAPASTSQAAGASSPATPAKAAASASTSQAASATSLATPKAAAPASTSQAASASSLATPKAAAPASTSQAVGTSSLAIVKAAAPTSTILVGGASSPATPAKRRLDIASAGTSAKRLHRPAMSTSRIGEPSSSTTEGWYPGQSFQAPEDQGTTAPSPNYLFQETSEALQTFITKFNDDLWVPFRNKINVADAHNANFVRRAKFQLRELEKARSDLASSQADCDKLDTLTAKLSTDNASLSAQVDGIEARITDAVSAEREETEKAKQQVQLYGTRFNKAVQDRDNAVSELKLVQSQLRACQQELEEEKREAEGWRDSFYKAEAREADAEAKASLQALPEDWRERVRSEIAKDPAAFVRTFQIPSSAFVSPDDSA